MNDINKSIVIGRITKDLGDNNFAYISTGIAKANISIAVNRNKKQGDEWINEVSYFEVEIWGKVAENLRPYLKKGQQVGIEGYLKQARWNNKTTNQQQSKVVIVAENVELLGGKGEKTEKVQKTEHLDSYNQPFPEDIPF